METKSTVFNGITLTEPEGSFRLGTDSLLCAAYMRSHSRDKTAELGCGSGVISLLLFSHKKIDTTVGIELDPDAAELCRTNITANRLDDRMRVICGDLRELDTSDFIGVSAVYANPPYMKVGNGKACSDSYAEAARHEHNGGIAEFCHAASRILKTGGSFYTVYRPDRLQSLMGALADAHLTPKRMTFVHSDELHSASSVLVEARKNGSEGLYLTPPLLLQKNGKPSEEADYIYRNGFFPKSFYNP